MLDPSDCALVSTGNAEPRVAAERKFIFGCAALSIRPVGEPGKGAGLRVEIDAIGYLAERA
jgi:hypothetical protein